MVYPGTLPQLKLLQYGSIILIEVMYGKVFFFFIISFIGLPSGLLTNLIMFEKKNENELFYIKRGSAHITVCIKDCGLRV